MAVVPELNKRLAADALTEATVMVDDPDDRRPVATTIGTAGKAGEKVIVVIEPELEYE